MKKLFAIILGILLCSSSALAARYVTTYSPARPSYTRGIYNGRNNLRNYNRFNRRNYNRYPQRIYDRPYDNPRYINRYGYGYNNYANSGSGLLNKITTFFTGTPTGMTPQVNPYWNDNFYAPNGKQTDFAGTNGWYHHNDQIGSGVGIKILD